MHRFLRRSRDSPQSDGTIHGGPRCSRKAVSRSSGSSPVSLLPNYTGHPMAETSTAVAPTAPSGADLRRAEEFAREPFVLEGEDAAEALAPGTARRRAFDAAIAELDAGRDFPSVEWRREFALILGLERVLNDEEPKLVDGTTLSAHQVDALSGTLIALTAAAQEAPGKAPAANGNGSNGKHLEELPSGELEIEGDEEVATDEEPLDWDPAEEAEEEEAADLAADDPNADRRFWFEHATGAGKTVAAARLRRGLAHGRRADPDPPPQPRRSVQRRARGPRLQEAHLRPADRQGQGVDDRRPGHRRDLPVVRAQRGQDLRRVHDRHLRRGPYRARREDQRVDPPVAGPRVRRHDRDGRPHRPPRDGPLPDPDLALRPRAGRAPRRDRAAALRADPAGRRRALDLQGPAA